VGADIKVYHNMGGLQQPQCTVFIRHGVRCRAACLPALLPLCRRTTTLALSDTLCRACSLRKKA
jgi:hypothetical protein